MSSKPLQSIYDLAVDIGVSPSTVSRVLNQRGRIAAATRQRILAKARAAGFRPRMTARQTTLALVMDRQHYANSTVGFIPLVLSSLIGMLSGKEVSVALFTEQNLNRLLDCHIDGVLALAWDELTINTLRSLKDVPIVTLNRMDVPEFSAVATDHRADGEMAVDYLYGKGHRRMAMLCEERENWGSRQRVEGFLERTKSMGLSVDEQLVAYTDHQPIYGQLRRLMGMGPTGLFIANESLGIEALYVLRDVLNLRVPTDVSVIGMESSRVSQFISPPLTTFQQPLDELTSASVDLLLGQIAEGSNQPARVMLKNRLIERESVSTVPVFPT